MNIKIIFLVLVIFLFISGGALAISGDYEGCRYETLDKISLFVSGQILKDQTNGIFSYSYTVKSNPQSQRNVRIIDIILPEKGIIIDAGSPSGRKPGWSGKPTKYSHLRDIKPPYSIGWFLREEERIKPTEAVSGFTFKTSFGLPGIVDYYAEDDGPGVKCPEYLEPDSIPGYDNFTPYGPGVVGKTIGPTAPPADFKQIDFLNYLIDLKHQSTSLGWIKDKGIEQSLDAKLDNAKKKIEQGNITTAKNILEAFINEVEAQGCESYDNCPQGKHLTPEAYALLKYNVQYLIERL